MPKVKDTAAALAHIESQIVNVLMNEVKNLVVEEMDRQIDLTVYSSYDPVMYKRRMENGGLGDQKNIVGTLVDNNTLRVKNETPSSPSVVDGSAQNLDAIVVHGAPNIFNNRDYPWMHERDFVQATKEALADGSLAQAVAAGLRRRGLKTRVKTTIK